MAPLIQDENGSELTKQPKPFARDKRSPVFAQFEFQFLHSTEWNGWNKSLE